MSGVRPWRLLGSGDIELVRRGLQPLATAWAEEWLPGTLPTVQVADAHDHPFLNARPSEQMLTLQHSDGVVPGRLFLCERLAASLRARTLETLGVPSGHGNGGSMVDSVVGYQLRDLLGRLACQPAHVARETSLFTLTALPSLDRRMGSGSVLVTVTLAGETARAWLSQAAVKGWLRPRSKKAMGPAPISRTKALAERRLAFRLLAGDASLNLADVLTLQPGNVIRLENGPDQAMRLVTGSGATLGNCYLGTLDGRPVIQFCS